VTAWDKEDLAEKEAALKQQEDEANGLNQAPSSPSKRHLAITINNPMRASAK
jgi:hypothetical protein